MTEATIFIAALDKPTEAERAAFLAEACAGDERLRRRVEALLRAHAEPDDILDPMSDRPRRDRRVDPLPAGRRAGRGHRRRPLQAPRADRRGRHGHGLDGRAARPGQAAGRPEADQARDGLQGRPGPLRGRAAGAGADGPPQHRQDPRRRHDPRRAGRRRTPAALISSWSWSRAGRSPNTATPAG